MVSIFRHALISVCAFNWDIFLGGWGRESHININETWALLIFFETTNKAVTTRCQVGGISWWRDMRNLNLTALQVTSQPKKFKHFALDQHQDTSYFVPTCKKPVLFGNLSPNQAWVLVCFFLLVLMVSKLPSRFTLLACKPLKENILSLGSNGTIFCLDVTLRTEVLVDLSEVGLSVAWQLPEMGRCRVGKAVKKGRGEQSRQFSWM